MPFWLPPDPILLASTSPTRRALLAGAGLPVDTEAPGIDERAAERGLGDPAPAALAARLARDKALAVAHRHPGRVVIGADQVLDLDGRPMGKPGSAAALCRQLEALSGRTHRLHSAFAIVAGPATETASLREGVASASLTVRVLDPAAIARYGQAAGAAAWGSAGGYQVEGLGIHLFDRIEGEQSTILGLPLLPVLAILRELGLLGI